MDALSKIACRWRLDWDVFCQGANINFNRGFDSLADLPRIIIWSKVEGVKISTLVENPDLQKGWGGCGEGHPRGGDQAGKDLCRLHGGQPGQHPKIGHVIKCDDQELATMINKGKGKLKWERDMPRDIEEKLEVMMMIVVMTMTMMMMVTMELIMVEIIMLRHNHFAVI